MNVADAKFELSLFENSYQGATSKLNKVSSYLFKKKNKEFGT